MMPRPLFHLSSKRPQRGLTLVELLVAMVLLSMLMLGMVSAMRSMAMVEERVDARLERADEFRVATAFLNAVLGRLSVSKITTPMKEGESPYLFAASESAVAWVGIMPARHGMGGRTFFRLAVEQVQGAHALVIRFVPLGNALAFPDWSQAQSRVLVHDVTSFALSYEDAKGPAPVWLGQWRDVEDLPARIQIQLATQAGEWPIWVIPMRTQPSSRRGGFVMGPTR